MSRLRTNSAFVMHANDNSAISESFRTLRINLDFSSFEQKVKTIAITSVNAGEGKTTTALNLAITCAHAGKKVILVDADLRKPELHIAFRRDNQTGLTDLLTYRRPVNEVIYETNIGNLFLITAGPNIHNPSELLASRQMDTVLSVLKHTYDVVLLDTPAALEIIDSKVVAAKCDGVLLVVEYGKVKSAAATKVKDDLVQVKANVLGAVLNKTDGKGVKVY